MAVPAMYWPRSGLVRRTMLQWWMMVEVGSKEWRADWKMSVVVSMYKSMLLARLGGEMVVEHNIGSAETNQQRQYAFEAGRTRARRLEGVMSRERTGAGIGSSQELDRGLVSCGHQSQDEGGRARKGRVQPQSRYDYGQARGEVVEEIRARVGRDSRRGHGPLELCMASLGSAMVLSKAKAL